MGASDMARPAPGRFFLTTVSYAARTCGRGRRPRDECTAARACRHERSVRPPRLAPRKSSLGPVTCKSTNGRAALRDYDRRSEQTQERAGGE